jgi:hypothetical protein
MGEEIDTTTIEAAAFHKAGPLNRLFHRIPLSYDLYSAENCRLECIQDDFSIYPCTDGYLNRDRQWSTKAELYVLEGKPEKLIFQVLDGNYAAGNFLDRFSQVCNDAFGEPIAQEDSAARWRNATSTVTAILHPDQVNADFLFELDHN